jgi:hypothetical protein
MSSWHSLSLGLRRAVGRCHRSPATVWRIYLKTRLWWALRTIPHYEGNFVSAQHALPLGPFHNF